MAAKDFQQLLDEFGEFNKQFTEDFSEGLRGDDARRFGVFVVGAEIEKRLESSITGLAAAGVELSKQGAFVQSEILELSKKALDANTEEAREIRKDLEGILSLTKNLSDTERKALEQMVGMAATSIGEVSDFGDVLMEGFMDSLPDFLTDSAKAAEKFLPGFLGKIAGNTIRAGRRRQQDEAVRAERFRRLGLGGGGDEDAEVADTAPTPVDVGPPSEVSEVLGNDKIVDILMQIGDKVCVIKDIMVAQSGKDGTEKLAAREAELESGKVSGKAAGTQLVETVKEEGGLGILGTAATEVTGEVIGNTIGSVLGRGAPKAMAAGVAQGQGLIFDPRLKRGSQFRDPVTGRIAKAPTEPTQLGGAAAAPKAGKLSKVGDFASAFATAAAGLAILAGALILFNQVEIGSIVKAMVTLPIFLGIMALAVKVMPPDKDLIKFGKSSMLLAGALAILGVGLLIFNHVSFLGMFKGAVALVALLGIMQVAMKTMPKSKDLIKFSIAAGLLGVALLTLGLGLRAMEGISLESGLVAMGTVLAIIGVAFLIGKIATKAMPGLLTFSLATIVLGVGLLSLGMGLRSFSDIGLENIVAAMSTVLVVLGIAALAGTMSTAAFPGILMFSLAMPLLAVGVAALGLALQNFAGVKIGAVGVLAATLATLGVAVAAFAIAIASGVGGVLILAAIGLIAALGAALIPFGFAAKLAGEAMKLLGQGAVMLGVGFKILVDSAGDFLTKFVDSIVRLGSLGNTLFVAAAGVTALGVALAAFGVGGGIGSVVGGIGGAIGGLFGGSSPEELMDLIARFAERTTTLPQTVTAVNQLRFALEQLSAAEINSQSIDELMRAMDRLGAGASLAGFFGMGGFGEFATFINAGEGIMKTSDAMNALGPALKNFAQNTMGEDFFQEGWFTESGWENLMEVLQEGIEEVDLDALERFGDSMMKLGIGLEKVANLNLTSLSTNLKAGVGAAGEIDGDQPSFVGRTVPRTGSMKAEGVETPPPVVKPTGPVQVTRRGRTRQGASMRARLALSKLFGDPTQGPVAVQGMTMSVEKDGGEFIATAKWSPDSERAAKQLSMQMKSLGGSQGGEGVSGVRRSSALTPDGETAVGAMTTNAALKSDASMGTGNINSVVAPVTNAPTVNNNQTVMMENMGARNNESSFRAAQEAQYSNRSQG